MKLSQLSLACVLALTLIGGLGDAAIAKQGDQYTCAFGSGFAAFRDALGPDIVGDCLSDQVSEPDGTTVQSTASGELSWNRTSNTINFREPSRVWSSGLGGIGTDVVVGGLNDQGTPRDPVRVTAAHVLKLAAVRPPDLGAGWSEGVAPPDVAPQARHLACAPRHPDHDLGSVMTTSLNMKRELVAMHLLYAVPDFAVKSLREEMESIIQACDNVVEQAGPATFRFRLRLEPFVELGDESLVLHVEIEHQPSGDRRTIEMGYVRYGGLTSMVTLTRFPNETVPASTVDLEWFAHKVDDRLHAAASQLRP